MAIDDQGITNSIRDLSNTIMSGSRASKETFRRYNEDLEDVLEQEIVIREKHMSAETKELQRRLKHLERAANLEEKQHTRIQEQLDKTIARQTEVYAKYKKAQKKLGSLNASDPKYKEFENTVAKLGESLNNLSEIANAKQDEVQQSANKLERLRENHQHVNELFEKRRLADVKLSHVFADRIKEHAKGLSSGTNAVKQFVAALKEGASAVSMGAKTGGYGLSVNPFSKNLDIWTAARMGMTPTEGIKMQADFRRTIMSTQRGMTEFMDGLKAAEREYADVITDPAERTAFAAKQMELATMAGVRFMKEDAVASSKELRRVAKLTGMAPMEFNEAIADIVSSEEYRARLSVATSEQERKAILAGVKSQFELNKAMGMTTEQAKAAAKSIQSMTNQGPQKRLIQAARIRAYGGAVGLGAESNRLAALLNKGKRTTPEEQAEMQRLAESLNAAFRKSTTGRIENEWFQDALKEQLDLESVIGLSSPHNTALSQAVAPLEQAADSMSKLTTALIEALSIFKAGHNSITKNPILLAGGAAGAYMLGNKITKMMPGGLFGPSGFGGFAGANAGPQLPPTTRAAIAGAKSTLAVKSMARMFGLPLAALGGYFEGMEEYEQSGDKGKAIGKGVGAAAGGAAGGWAGATMGAQAGAALGTVILPGFGTAAGAVIGGLAGGLGGGYLGNLAGGAVGKSVGSVFTKSTEEERTLSARVTAEASQQQVQQMDANNNYLKTLADNSQKQLELTSKHMELVDKSTDKTTAAIASAQDKSSPFTTKYTYNK